MSLFCRWLALCLLAFLPVWPLGAAQAASVLFIATSNVPPGKFRLLAEPVLEPAEIDRFIALAERLPELTAAEVAQLSIQAKPGVLATAPAPKGLF